MKGYTSCFIGVPLPDVYQQEFEVLLENLAKTEPQLEIVHPDTPHITINYLNNQSQFNLPDIVKRVKTKIAVLKNAEITVGGFGYFRGDKPRVLFLNVLYPEVFREINQAITRELIKYGADDNKLPFHPHLTVGKLTTLKAQQAFKDSVNQLELKLNQVNWFFSIKEVVLYGVDSTKHPQYQEKLITISIS